MRTGQSGHDVTHGKMASTKIESPFFHDMGAAILEADIVSALWLVQIVAVSMATIFTNQKVGQSTIWTFDVRPHTFNEASGWSGYNLMKKNQNEQQKVKTGSRPRRIVVDKYSNLTSFLFINFISLEPPRLSSYSVQFSYTVTATDAIVYIFDLSGLVGRPH